MSTTLISHSQGGKSGRDMALKRGSLQSIRESRPLKQEFGEFWQSAAEIVSIGAITIPFHSRGHCGADYPRHIEDI